MKLFHLLILLSGVTVLSGCTTVVLPEIPRSHPAHPDAVQADYDPAWTRIPAETEKEMKPDKSGGM